MRDFIAIDFETGNPKRVSACAIGYAKIENGEVTASNGHLIKPVGGHAPFQSKIHGIKEENTFDKPDFGELFPDIKDIFNFPLIAHSMFDKQVLDALAEHFDLSLSVEYFDTSAMAKVKLPDLKNHKLKTLVKHFELPKFKHHDATEDAIACANIFLKLQDGTSKESPPLRSDDKQEFKRLIYGILADDEVDYKEACALLYWLEDHEAIAKQHANLYMTTKAALADDHLDTIEAAKVKRLLMDINPSGPLLGEVVVFTGALMIPRNTAAALAADLGCEVGTSVTKKTTLLVVGDQDVEKLAGHKKSVKHRKAEELISKGQSIRILRESDFQELSGI